MFFILVGGANGVGKTAFVKSELKFKYTDTIFINPDDIAQVITDQSKDQMTIQILVSQEIDKLVRNAVFERKNIVIESNLHTSSPFDRAKNIQRHGYETVLLYLYTDNIYINRLRIDERTKNKTGHYVDDKTLNERYSKGLTNVISRLKEFQHTLIVNNSNVKAIEICHFENGIISDYKKELDESAFFSANFSMHLTIAERLREKGAYIKKDKGFSL